MNTSRIFTILCTLFIATFAARAQQASDVKTALETIGTTPQLPPAKTPPGFKHYNDFTWGFELDIPENWNMFPPNHENSPGEVLRFASNEKGTHLLIVFRDPHDPERSLEEVSDSVQQVLAKAGFGNFVSGETTIGGKLVRTLDFDRPAGDGTWSCRHYFIADGTLVYTLGFGTTDKAGMFDTFDRMAKSFRFVTPSN